MTEEMSLAVFDPFKALAAKAQEEDAALQIDHTTPDGETKLRSWVRTVRGYRSGLEKIRVAAKANALEYGRTVDKLAKELKTPFDTIITDRMKPLDDMESVKRQAAEAKVEAERVEAERIETARLADLKRREDEVARKEAEQKAAEDAANAEQRETERVEREKRIAEEAAAEARKEAEEKAERERIAAIAAAEAEKDRLAEIEANRVADVNHRATVKGSIYDTLFHITQDHAVAQSILDKLVLNKIPYVTINY
ncbi:hypothetical protein LCGC14_2797470 [marine sediment metagenome]|uniref:Uncharacterized protein n=1 Tax=marine sediment metagenome TaxID=412755 RepID=A0A0F9AXD4_9ZZZZ